MQYKYCENCNVKNDQNLLECNCCGCKLPDKVYKKRKILPFILSAVVMTIFLIIRKPIINKEDSSIHLVISIILYAIVTRFFWGTLNKDDKILFRLYLQAIDFLTAFLTRALGMVQNLVLYSIGRKKLAPKRSINIHKAANSRIIFGIVYIGFIAFTLLFWPPFYTTSTNALGICGITWAICSLLIPITITNFFKL